MATQAQIQARIDQIDEDLASGVTSTSTDGTTVSVNLESLRAERRRLQRLLDKPTLPRNMRVNLRHG